jgi:hypothetical protein
VWASADQSDEVTSGGRTSPDLHEPTRSRDGRAIAHWSRDHEGDGWGDESATSWVILFAAGMPACDRVRVTDGRTVWMISAVIEASEEDARAAQEAIARALCPDENHAGYCPVPWTTLACRFNDLDDEERAQWKLNSLRPVNEPVSWASQAHSRLPPSESAVPCE